MIDSGLVQVTLISASAAVVGPLLLSYLNNRQANAREARNFTQQDEIARRVAEVANTAAHVAAETKNQLIQIHTLVNSDMTAARQMELDQTRMTLITLKRIVEIARLSGSEADAADVDLIKVIEVRVNELEAILADRLVQVRLVEAERK